MMGLKLIEDRCPDCGNPPAERGQEPDEEDGSPGDTCSHPCHDDEGGA